MKFKDYLYLSERIYSSQGKVTITAQTDKGGSSKEEISTYLPVHGIPHVSVGKMTHGVPVYSAFNAVAAGADGETTLLLKALKGIGPYSTNDKQVGWLLSATAKWLKTFLTKEKIDVILYPKSSSSFLHDFVDQLKKEYPSIIVVDNAFSKREVKSIDDEIDDFINKEDPDYEKIGAKNQDQLKKSIKRIIAKNIEDGKGATLDAKKLFKGHAKFVQNFMQFAAKDDKSIIDKHVLIVDDILSSGSTFVDMARQLKSHAPSKISGFVLFKVVSTAK